MGGLNYRGEGAYVQTTFDVSNNIVRVNYTAKRNTNIQCIFYTLQYCNLITYFTLNKYFHLKRRLLLVFTDASLSSHRHFILLKSFTSQKFHIGRIFGERVTAF
jgi:hypothetical protein